MSIAHAAASSRIAIAEESPAALAYSDAMPATTSRELSATQSDSSPSDPLQLMREAEAAVGTLTAYLTRADAPPPAFLDPAVRLEAAGVRSRLHARLDARERRSMQIEAPAWTLDDHRAALLCAYRIQPRAARRRPACCACSSRDGDAWRVSNCTGAGAMSPVRWLLFAALLAVLPSPACAWSPPAAQQAAITPTWSKPGPPACRDHASLPPRWPQRARARTRAGRAFGILAAHWATKAARKTCSADDTPHAAPRATCRCAAGWRRRRWNPATTPPPSTTSTPCSASPAAAIAS